MNALNAQATLEAMDNYGFTDIRTIPLRQRGTGMECVVEGRSPEGDWMAFHDERAWRSYQAINGFANALRKATGAILARHDLSREEALKYSTIIKRGPLELGHRAKTVSLSLTVWRWRYFIELFRDASIDSDLLIAAERRDDGRWVEWRTFFHASWSIECDWGGIL